MALTEASEFILARFNPKGALAALAEFGIFSNHSGVGIESISVEGEMVRDIKGDSGGCTMLFVGASAILMGGIGAFEFRLGFGLGMALGLATATLAGGSSTIVISCFG
jgi:hypothetical protein